jgi:hypothetical protein
MWDIRFWIFFILAIVITGVIAAIKKIRFIDVQLVIMVAALALSCDMLLCKQFNLYHYIDPEFRGWYSFWANLFIVPAWGFLFIKFVPKKNDNIKGTAVYIIAWTIASTLFELFVVRPLGIVIYNGWNVILYSSTGYFVVLTWIYVYYRLMLRYRNKKGDSN